MSIESKWCQRRGVTVHDRDGLVIVTCGRGMRGGAYSVAISGDVKAIQQHLHATLSGRQYNTKRESTDLQSVRWGVSLEKSP